MKHYDLPPEQWELIRSEFPPPGSTGGRPRRDCRVVLNGALWILHTGSPWRAVPPEYGPWQTVYRYFAQWVKDGTFERVLAKLQGLLEQAGQIQKELWCVDSSLIRASQAAAGGGKRGTQGNRRTSRWAAPEEATGRNSISSATRRASHSPSRLHQAKRANVRSLSRS
jgi:transposase